MPSPEITQLIVLHQTKHSDHGIVLHTIDAQAGRRSFLVRGLRRSGATAAFHPLSLLEAVAAASPKSSLAYLREWTPLQPLPGIRGDLVKSSVAMFISEVLYRSLVNEQADPQLFDWLCRVVQTLDAEERSIANFPVWFLVSYAVQMGFMPGETPEPGGIFSPPETALFYRILRTDYAEALAIPLSAERRQEFSRSMLQYLSYHLGTTLNAKSLDVLHAVLQD